MTTVAQNQCESGLMHHDWGFSAITCSILSPDMRLTDKQTLKEMRDQNNG
jgi:hypothetical protein